MTQQTFEPFLALARYQELDALLHLELFNRPDWQKRRARGDTTFLLESKHFQEQNCLLETISANGYDIIDHGDDEAPGYKPIYGIEKSEDRL